MHSASQLSEDIRARQECLRDLLALTSCKKHQEEIARQKDFQLLKDMLVMQSIARLQSQIWCQLFAAARSLLASLMKPS